MTLITMICSWCNKWIEFDFPSGGAFPHQYTCEYCKKFVAIIRHEDSSYDKFKKIKEIVS